MHKIESWDMCSARALARKGRRALQRAFHGGDAVAAAWTALEVAGRMARPGRLQREATGGGGGAARRVGASATEKRRPGSLSMAPASVPSVGGGAKQSREVEVEEKGDFAISKSSRD